ncbi:MAG: hypothetical protein ACAI44_11380, partial [Candidatus Sericytochromatia bacterium]
VVRNADGSLSIPLPAGRQPDSHGLIEILLTDGRSQSWLLRFDTGPLLELADNPIAISPSSQVVLGTRTHLQANFAGSPDLSPYLFSWSVATSAQGPFTPISGTAPAVDWEPATAGNYLLRLEIRDTRSGAASVYTSPAALVFVAAPDRIVVTEPAEGRILAGDEIRLRANVPELKNQTNWLWSYSQSPVGPFQPIAGQGAVIDWEPPAAGAYYLRLQTTVAGQQSTYTSARPLVLVSNADEVISTEPASGEVTRGLSVRLNAQVPNTEPSWRHLWSYAASPTGPFTAIPGEGASISWNPDVTGEFYLRVRVINPADGAEKTYTSAKVLISVRDSDQRFVLTPEPANLVRGQSLLLGLQDVPGDRSINWFYATGSAGPFLIIPGQGQNVRWTPPVAGTFYLRAEVTGGDVSKSTFTSASALVSVSEASGVISASPEGSQPMGRPVTLTAHLPETPADASYAWSVGPSPNGPWQAAQSLDADPRGPSLNWYPGASGNYFVKVDVNTAQGNVLSFISPRALVFVTPSRDFFATNPTPAVIGTQGAVTLSANFPAPDSGSYTYAWSSALAPTGPYSAIGASVTPKFSWVGPGLAGNYFIKLDVISPTRRAVSFLSSEPIVFVGESQAGGSGFPF